METYIFRKHNLPNEAKIAITKEDGDGVTFIQDLTKHHEVGKIGFYISLVLFCISAIAFLNVLIKQTGLFNKGDGFDGIAVGIVGAFFFFASLFFIIMFFYAKKKNNIKKQIASGELKFGVWITPNYLIVNHLWYALQCVEIKNIASISVYKQTNTIWLYLQLNLKNKQNIKFLTNHLNVTNNNSEILKEYFSKMLHLPHSANS